MSISFEDHYVLDSKGGCKNKYQISKKYGKVDIYPIVDTMNSNKSLLFRNDELLSELNNITNKYVLESQKNRELIAILDDLNIDENSYWETKPIAKKPLTGTNNTICFNIYEDLDFVIKEMVCTLKNIEGDYTYCKARLFKIYSAILDYITGGGIKARRWGKFGQIEVKIKFSEKFKKYNVPKNYEVNPLYDSTGFKLVPNTKKYNRKSISGRVRQDVLMRDNYTCQICGATVDDDAKLEIDHIIPVSKGGTDNKENLQVLCQRCNREKHNRDDLLHDKNKLEELNGRV